MILKGFQKISKDFKGFPLDVARTRLSINTPNSDLKESGLFKTLIWLKRKEGIKGLYKGYSFAFVVNIFI